MAQAFTLAEFRQYLQVEESKSLERLENQYVAVATSVLQSDPYNYPLKTAEKYARGVVVSGGTLQSDSGSGDYADIMYDCATALVKAKVGQWLFLMAPVSNSMETITSPAGVKEERIIPFDEDRERRAMQFESFWSLFSDQSTLKYENIPKEMVLTAEDMKAKVEAFITGPGSTSSTAAIVFNGHGMDHVDAGSMYFENGGPYMLDDFLGYLADLKERVHASQRKRLPAGVPPLPADIFVIFAQCHGHLYQELADEDITVRPLTSQKHPCTNCFNITSEIPGKTMRKVDISDHVELNDAVDAAIEQQQMDVS